MTLKYKKADWYAIGLFFLYCLLFATIRLQSSPYLDLDEAEQFIEAAGFSWGYSREPPLYTWIVWACSALFGLNIYTLILVKYCCLLLFYLAFYFSFRSFWDTKPALAMSTSAWSIFLYAYEFNRHLTNTILVTALAATLVLLACWLLNNKSTWLYALFGATAGLGMLSKYNFAFLLLSFAIAALIFNDVRKVVCNRRITIALLLFIAVVLPHGLWLMDNHFVSMLDALQRTNPGTLEPESFIEIITYFASAYVDVLIFVTVFAAFFWNCWSFKTNTGLYPKLFLSLTVCALVTPLIIIVLLNSAHFSAKWLAPVLFLLPLSLFQYLDLEKGAVRLRNFSWMCSCLVMIVLTARVAIGFLPDTVGKAERTLLSFNKAASVVHKRIKARGIGEMADLTITSDQLYLAVNLALLLPEAKPRHISLPKLNKPAVLAVWQIKDNHQGIPSNFSNRYPILKLLEPLEIPYLRSKKLQPFKLGLALGFNAAVL